MIMAGTMDLEQDETSASTPHEATGTGDVRYVPAPATDYYTRIGIGVASGLALVAMVAIIQPAGLGLFELGTTMVMIGLSFTILFTGLLVALFILRKTLRSIDARAEYLAALSLRKAISKDRVYASADALEGVRVATDDLTAFGARQAEAITALKTSSQDHAATMARLSKEVGSLGRHDDAEWAALQDRMEKHAAEADRLAADNRRATGELERLAGQVEMLHAKDDGAITRLGEAAERHADEIARIAAELAEQSERLRDHPDGLGRLQAAADKQAAHIGSLAADLAKSDARWAQLIARVEDDEHQHRQAIQSLVEAGEQRMAEHSEQHATSAKQQEDRHAHLASEQDATRQQTEESLRGLAADLDAVEPRQAELADLIEAAERHQADAIAGMEDRVAADVSALDERTQDAVRSLDKKVTGRVAAERKQREAAVADLADHVADAHQRADARGQALEDRVKAAGAAVAKAEQGLAAEETARKSAVARIAGRVNRLGTARAAVEGRLAADAKTRDAQHRELARQITAMETAHQAALRSLKGRATAQRKTLDQMTRHEKAFNRQLEKEAAARDAALKSLKAEESRIAERLAKNEKSFDARHRRAAASMRRQRAELQAEITTIAADEDHINRRLAAGAVARRRAVKALKDQEARIEKRVAANENELRHAVGRLETERLRLDKITRRILEEERQRRKEFEALAGEEIRLMSRVLRRNEANGAAQPEPYWMDRAKAADKGPFGRVYRVAEVEGVTAAHARKLRKLGIRSTQDLWHADTGFLADYLRVDADVVDLWQEEAELMAINGIGGSTAEALATAGVTSVQKLGSEDAAHLVSVVTKAHPASDGSNGVRVTVKSAEKWIKDARRHAPKK
jgi:chromosome segregation ATPase